ncbi:E3 ubiquitin-protein ligase listerin [Dufourea novaeangliae]|uniref:E3 ubiquitin-protein ligase listerin n=1 Tax=Dufourea novaeangliae TaxID=178035 RepID=A0A154PAP3_DUFNO|nr:E3 ubiquitin-protein ligase listerin [Dufourea novaeangliae]
MGKNKQAQRTKNNARPSNSSRSAELLGTAIPKFVGFSAVKDGGYVPVLPGLSLCSVNEIEMSNVDSNFQIVLKKMNKKDATTKCKALQEFAVLCKDSEFPAVEGMLPFWPRLYCALAIDIEHRVREAAQLAHAAVVKRVGKGIAVYLKQLAGAWFTSQHDMYPPAASAASNSFNDTFPSKKIIDAIVHCQREILMYICDNVTVHTAQSLSLQKSLTVEEMEAKYQRVLVASLQGYSFYLKKVPVEEIEKMVDIHRKIISNNKFWKLVKYDVLPVKTAFFNVLTSVIENANILLQEEKKRTVTTIMNSLDEMEPALLSAVWEAMLVTINKIEDWYCVVSIEKLVLPKLWRVLRSGGQCSASIVYPNLLPFISQFPKLNVDVHNLYMNFFSNMRHGFSLKSVQTSRSEMFAVTTSFTECLRYSVLLNVNNQDLCTALLKEQLIPVLETCLKEKTQMKEILFREIIQLVRYWSKNRHNEDYKSYIHLIQRFWIELDSLFNSLIDASQNSETFNTPDTNNSQIEFLITLKTAPMHSRKNLKVKFSNPEEDTNVEPETPTTEVDTDTKFLAELNNFVNSLCIKYFDKISEQRTQKYVIHLNKLITCFESEKLFINLSESLKTQINFFSFYDQVLRQWLLEQSTETEHIVELIFNLIMYMNESEKEKVLKSLTGFEDVVTTRSVVYCALSKKRSRDNAIIKKWCSPSKITSLLIDVAKEIASGNYSDLEKNQDLILLALEPSDDGNLLVKEDGVNEIVSILCNSIHEVDEACLLHFAQLISCIVPLTWAHKRSTLGGVQVLETLFELCSQNYFSNNGTFIETMRNVWKNGLLEAVRKLSRLEFIELTRKFASIMWKKIYNSNEEHTNETLVDVSADFLGIIINNDVHMEETHVQEIILTFLTDSDIATWMAEVTGIILYGEVITGELYVFTLDQSIQLFQKRESVNLISNTVVDNTENCLKWALFNTNLLNNICLRSTDTDQEREESNIEKPSIQNVKLPGIIDLLVDIMYSVILGRIYTNYYKSTKCYSNVKKILTTIQDNFKQLQTYVTEDTCSEILSYIKMNSDKYGSMLSYLIYFCRTELSTSMAAQKVFEVCNKNIEISLQGSQVPSEFHTSDIYKLIVARNKLRNQEDDSDCFSLLEKIISYEKENFTPLLFDCDLSATSWEQLTLPLEIIRLLAELATKIPSKLTSEHWNFILISLVMWRLTLNKSRQHINDFKVSAFTVAICQLYYAVQNVIYKQEQIKDLPPTLLDEWNNVFAGDLQSGFAQTWMFYADWHNERTNALKAIVVLDHVGNAVKLLNGNVLFKTQLYIVDSAVAVDLNSAVGLSLRLLLSPVASIQLGAYHLLKHTVPELVDKDKATVEMENFDVNTLNIKQMEDRLQNTQNIVNTILMDFKLCDTVSCTIQPYTDFYTCTVGYLLSWAIILDMCANAHGDLLYQYAEVVKDNFFPSLLNNIFRLMPVEVLQDNKNKGASLMELFSTEPSLEFGESWTEWRLDHIVCWLYRNSLRHLPVLVRQWWSTSDSRVSAAVDKITTHYVSPMLCQELLNNKLQNIENMQVKVHATFREVMALYQMDDTKLELNIILPPNHPLGPVTVEPGQHAGGTANWRNCHMQLSIFLTHQNGSVWDGLALWKKNLDKKFAGVEECYICFSIFHSSSYQIPKLSCHTCRKKFHTACMYKWFSTSQKSTCPICRNIF